MANFNVKSSMEMVEDSALKNLKAMVKRGKNSRSFLQLHAYPVYIKAQMQRWMTEGASQNEKWDALNPAYAAYKLKKFSTAPGGGRKIMIATGKLYQSVIGAGEGHFKMITDNEMIVGTSVPYATYPSARRKIMHFDKGFIKILKKKWIDYIIRGKGS